jgi:hypothetical protein
MKKMLKGCNDLAFQNNVYIFWIGKKETNNNKSKNTFEKKLD